MGGEVDRLAAEVELKTQLLLEVKEQVLAVQRARQNQEQVQEQIAIHMTQMEQLGVRLTETVKENQELQRVNDEMILEIGRLQSDVTTLSQEKNELTSALQGKREELSSAVRESEEWRKKAVLVSELRTQMQALQVREEQLTQKTHVQAQQLQKERARGD